MADPMRRKASIYCPVALAGLLLLGGGLGCKNTSNTEGEGDLDSKPLEEGATDRPVIVFPVEARQKDPDINKFVQDALEISAKGDFDKFRELCGINFRTPGETQFQRGWRGIKQIAVAGIIADPRKSDEYYVHVVIQLRKPNRQERTELHAVLRVHKEEDQYRLDKAPSEITRLIIATSTQPSKTIGTRPADTRLPHGLSTTTRPTATSPSGEPLS